MKKSELRSLFLDKRIKLSTEEYKILNEKLVSRVQSIDLKNIRHIHIFLPIIQKKEIDTFPVIVWLKDQHPGIKIIIPKADFSNHTLINFIYNEDMLLEENRYGILEPSEGELISPEKIDMVLVPLLAFDLKGYRVGYGKGFYDRFLSECRKDVKKTGLSFFEPVEKIEDTDPFDVKLGQCITPDKVYDFS
jgi:5-formyltetrahydrofolate cyclo-ligase